MAQAVSNEESLITLIDFLMQSKHRVIELGAGFGLTGMQTMLLALLSQPQPMNYFRRVFNCDASNVTGLVDGLEQKQLVCRFEADEDRRIKLVGLTVKGTQLRTKLLTTLSMVDSPLLSHLTPAESATFFELLQKMIQHR